MCSICFPLFGKVTDLGSERKNFLRNLFLEFFSEKPSMKKWDIRHQYFVGQVEDCRSKVTALQKKFILLFLEGNMSSRSPFQ
jgi:hypothetical protein